MCVALAKPLIEVERWSSLPTFNVVRSQQAVDQGILDDDEELTPAEDMDELEGILVPAGIWRAVPSVPQNIGVNSPAPKF